MLLFRWAQCRSAQPMLWDYASERLSEEAMERVEQHLRGCAACHKELDSLKRAQNLLAACRAQDEPAPRSDWNDLQQRLVADGLAQIAPSTAGSRASNPARRERGGMDRFGMAGRAPWTLQLATSAAGGFAAVLVLALGYQALHLRDAPGSAGMAAAKSMTGGSVASVTPPARTVSPPAADSQTARMEESIINAFGSLQARGASVVHDSTPAKVQGGSLSTPETKTGTAVNVSLRRHEDKPEGRFVRVVHIPVTPASSAMHRWTGDKTLVAVNNSPKFRNSDMKPVRRRADAPMIQATDRYALERVQPVGTESDDSNAYVVGSVRPIARDDEGVY